MMNDRRENDAMRALCQQWFGCVTRGEASPEQAAKILDRAGVPFEVQCRVLMTAQREAT